MQLSAIMTPDPVTIGGGASLDEAIELMEEHLSLIHI